MRNTNIKNLVKESTTEILISKLIETMLNVKLGVLNVAIQEELESRIGENKVDAILEENRK